MQNIVIKISTVDATLLSTKSNDIIISAEIYEALEEKIRSQISVVSLRQYEAMDERERMKRLFQFVDFGEVLVKGKKGPVRVYGIPE